MASLPARETARQNAAGMVLARGSYRPLPPAAVLRREPADEAAEQAPASERVWRFSVTRGMCGCRRQVAQWASDARLLAESFRRCGADARQRTMDDIYRCASAAAVQHVRQTAGGAGAVAVAAGSTGLFGPIRCERPAPGPCGRIAHRGCIVHETFHDRQRRALGAAVGGRSRVPARGAAFTRAYLEALPEPDEEAAHSRIGSAYPEEYRSLVLGWVDRDFYVRNEIEAFTRQSQFLADVGRALGRLCP